MKICLDARVGTKGGTSTFVDGFLGQLNAMSHSVDRTEHTIEILAHPHQKLSTDSTLAIPANRMQELMWAQRSLPNWLASNRFDIYHSLKHVGPLICPCCSVYRVPAIGQFDGTYPLSLRERFYWAHLAKRAYRKADLLIAVSDYIRDGLIEHLDISPDKVITIHNGVDGRFQRLPDEEIDRDWFEGVGITRPFILSVGNVLPVKNVESTIHAFGHLIRDGDFTHDLVIAGSAKTSYAIELRRLVESNGIADRVHFIGFNNQSRLIQLYSATDALVHMSSHEGFSLTILEAMSCGVPIIAARTSSIPEAAGKAARYVEDPFDRECIAQQIATLLASDRQRIALSQAALKRSKRFTWQACVEKTLEAYAQIETPSCAV